MSEFRKDCGQGLSLRKLKPDAASSRQIRRRRQHQIAGTGKPDESFGTPAQTLSTATYKVIEWSSVGQARVVGTPSSSITLYIRNGNPGVSTGARDFRIDIAPLTGSTMLTEAW